MDDPRAAIRQYVRQTARWIAVAGTALFFAGLWLAGIRGVEDFVLSTYDERYHMCRRIVNVETKETGEIVKVCKEWLDQRGTLHRLRDFELIQQEGRFYVVPRGPNYPLLGLLAFAAAIMTGGFHLHRFLIRRRRDRLAATPGGTI